MALNPSSSATLPCEQCGFLNEAERVYCHQCGTKLDRSLLPKNEEKKKQETPDQAKKRIAKMTNPGANVVWRETKALFKVAIYSALLAAVIQIAKVPEGVPEDKKGSSERLVSSDMMEALESPTPRAIGFTETEVNHYLKQTIKTKDGILPGLELVRAFVNFRPGAMRITSEQSLFGLPLYTGVEYALEVKDGKFMAKVIGGNFGRLAIDPLLMGYAQVALDNVNSALQRERKQMDRMKSVTIQKERIELLTKGTAVAK